MGIANSDVLTGDRGVTIVNKPYSEGSKKCMLSLRAKEMALGHSHQHLALYGSGGAKIITFHISFFFNANILNYKEFL